MELSNEILWIEQLSDKKYDGSTSVYLHLTAHLMKS